MEVFGFQYLILLEEYQYLIYLDFFYFFWCGCRVADEKGIETPTRVSGTKRVPLSEIPVNTPSLFNSRYKSPLGHGQFCESFGVNPIVDVPVENGRLLDSFRTPMKQPECSRLSGSFTVPRSIDDDDDDDFDESVLEEIDALCAQKSMEKAERSAQSDTFLVDIFKIDNGDDDLNSSSESLPNRGISGLGDDVGLDNSQCIEIGKMPEEFSKYMLSLNDRQREAACCDISRPLMIVAGPGSGKVFLFLSLVCVLTALV